MTGIDLDRRLAAEPIVRLTAEEWEAIASGYVEIERHDTMMAGALVIIRTPHGLAAVEQPKAAERVVRLLGDPDATRRFVEDRMAQYERMWDGCGCRVQYYE